MNSSSPQFTSIPQEGDYNPSEQGDTRPFNVAERFRTSRSLHKRQCRRKVLHKGSNTILSSGIILIFWFDAELPCSRMPPSGFTSISLRTEVIQRIRLHQVRKFKLATLEGVEMPPSLSKWIQAAIEQRLAREALATDSEPTTSVTSEGEHP